MKTPRYEEWRFGPRWPVKERLWRHISPEPNTGCWLWAGHCCPKGYGKVGLNGKTARAHRVAYEAYIGAIPKGLTLDHLCRVRCCVNPNHLEPVTHKENVLRGESPSARHARLTHCPQGHPYSGKNLLFSSGSRRCRICLREHQKRYEAKVRARKAFAATGGEGE